MNEHTSREEISHSISSNLARPLAAALVIAGLGAGIYLSIGRSTRATTAYENLIELSSRVPRRASSRLDQFRWTPLRPVVRGGTEQVLTPLDLRLAGAAGSVLEGNLNRSDGKTLHQIGVAYLMLGRTTEAVKKLDAASGLDAKSSHVWNDLAAAYLASAAEESREADLPLALAASDNALNIDPSYPAALFNRALAIEQIGHSTGAKRAWKRYLAVEPAGDWNREARKHLHELDLKSTKPFAQELEIAIDAFGRGIDEPMQELVRTYPQDSRRWGEGEILARWGEAFLAGDHVRAAKAFDVAKRLGQLVVERSEEGLLEDSVSAIELATVAKRRALAGAHVLYRKARILYSQRKVAGAVNLLAESSKAFSRGSSPMALVADYYHANALYDQRRLHEARGILENLLLHTDSGRYRAQAAQTKWELALCEISVGNWGRALELLQEALVTFQALGETGNASFIRGVIADVMELVARPEEGWAQRVEAIRGLSLAGMQNRLDVVLIAAVRAEITREKPDSALSLLSLAIDQFIQSGNRVLLTDAYVRKALILQTLETTKAAASVEDARRIAMSIEDASLRMRSLADVNFASGVVSRARQPEEAITRLSAALEFYAGARLDVWTTQALLERGRAYAAVGSPKNAIADFERGISELEVQRDNLGVGELRSGLFDVAPQLFEEAIDLLLREGSEHRALEFVERSRGRTLQDRRWPGTTGARALTEDDSITVSYAILPTDVAAFLIHNRTVSVHRLGVDRRKLEIGLRKLEAVVRGRGTAADFKTRSAEMYQILVGPIREKFASVTSIRFVPDRMLFAVPFPALFDPVAQRYLVEDFAVTVAPSVGSLASPTRQHAEKALLIADPARNDGLPSLPNARREVSRIAKLYDNPTMLNGADADASSAVRELSRHTVVHYAGHARADSANEHYLALSHSNGGRGNVYSREISELPLDNLRVVVLAACETLQGERDRIEGVPSIAGSFLAAGARTVVGTLWEIDDEASESLFIALHENLRAGATVPMAVRRSQLKLLNSPRLDLSHPRVWGGVQVLSYH